MQSNTLFPDFVNKYFYEVSKGLVKKINQSNPSIYLFKKYFKNRYEPTLKFESILGTSFIVAADVVVADSELPLKKRNRIAKAEGYIPKIGMKMQIRETDMNNIDIMIAQNKDGFLDERIASLIFSDVKKCIEGIYSRIEYMAMKSISTGVMEVKGDDSDSRVSTRIEYSIPKGNKTTVGVSWKEKACTPIDDIEKVINQSLKNGHRITSIFMRPEQFNQLKRSSQVNSIYGSSINLNLSPIISVSRMNELLMEEYGVNIHIMNSIVTTEKNGVQTSSNPWEEDTLVFYTGEQLGDLSYGSLAEEKRPVPGVNYQKVDDYILISKFGKTDPLAEFTASQAYAIPVLNNVECIYQLKTKV